MPEAALVVDWICEWKSGQGARVVSNLTGPNFVYQYLIFFGCLACRLQRCGFCQVSIVLDTCHSRGCSFEGKSTESDRVGRVSSKASSAIGSHTYSSVRDVVGQTKGLLKTMYAEMRVSRELRGRVAASAGSYWFILVGSGLGLSFHS